MQHDQTKRRRSFTPEEDLQLLNRDRSVKDIAIIQSRSRVSCQVRLKYLLNGQNRGPKIRPFTPIDDREIVNWKGTHISLAAKLGRDARSVRRRARQLGCPKPTVEPTYTRRYTAAQDMAILSAPPGTLHSLATELGRSLTTLYCRRRWLRKWHREQNDMENPTNALPIA